MENQTRYYRRPRLSTRALTTRVAAAAAAAALVLGGGISWQMAKGADPALGPKAQSTAQTAQQPRRVVKTLVIKRLPSSTASGGAAASTGASTAASSPAPTSSPAPVTSSTS